MSVEQSDVVDFIGIEKDTNRVVLTVSDHLEWNDDHLFALQEKLNTYIAFVESGEILEKYPDSKGRNVKISVVFKYAPDESAVAFLSKVKATLENIAIRFEFKVIGSD